MTRPEGKGFAPTGMYERKRAFAMSGGGISTDEAVKMILV